jgi:fumarate reductase subunit D
MREHDEYGPSAWIYLICMVILKGFFVIFFIGVQHSIHYCLNLLPIDSPIIKIEIFCVQLLIAIGTLWSLTTILFKKGRKNPRNIPWYR